MSPADKRLTADVYELEYIETESGDVYASALVAPSGEILAITDDDGNDLLESITIRELERIKDMIHEAREMRRAEAA